MSTRNTLALVCMLFVSVLLVPGVAPTPEAGPYTFTTIDFPGALILSGDGSVLRPQVTLTTSEPATQVRVNEAYGKLPLSFEVNRGQTDEQVKFLSRGAGRTLFLTSTEAVLVLTKPGKTTVGKPERREKAVGTPLRMAFLNANPRARAAGRDELPGKVNYLIGNDPTKWRTNVPTYAKVHYHNLYPGIDLVYYGNQRQLEYDLVVRPGADPGTIALGFRGADSVEVDAQGDLVLHTAAGVIRQRKPRIYQDIGGIRREIAGGYILKEAQQVGFQVAVYAASQPLIIDPTLVYSTYLGGNSDDLGAGIAVDAAGNAYIAGSTQSTPFPTAGPVQSALGGFADVFVTKLDPTGAQLVYSTYLGGSNVDVGQGIAVDTSGNAYVTGNTSSGDFPTTAGAFQTTPPGAGDAFVTKLNATGSQLVYSTYLGGASFGDGGAAIAVDAAGSAYVTGQTSSSSFPTTSGAFQTSFGGAPFGRGDAFVTKLNPSGSALVYSSYLGGSRFDVGTGVAVDAAGNAYVTGGTSSTDFPTPPGAFQPTFGGANNCVTGTATCDAFVTKVNPSGTALVYSTYLGGPGEDSGSGIAVDAAGNAYVTGLIKATGFPVTSGAFQTTFGGAIDAYVAKLNPSGAVVYSTYLGGSGTDLGFAIAVDAGGSAYVAGFTNSADFPVVNAIQPAPSGKDLFLAIMNPFGSGLTFSTYLGGGVNDQHSNTMALDATGNVYLTGQTGNFSTTACVFQRISGGGGDAFVAKINPSLSLTITIDIKPGEFPNAVPDTDVLNLSAQGTVPLGMFTTSSFNAGSVDACTVLFAGAPPVRSSLQDSDGDGDLDLVLHFNTQDLNLTCADTQAVMIGQTTSGTPIKGTDSIRVLKDKNGQKCP